MFSFIFSNKIFIKIPLINSLGSFHLWRLGRSCCKPKPFQAQPNYHHQTNIQQITHTHTHTQSNIEDKGPTIPIHFILGNLSQHGSAFIEVAETSRVVWQSLGYLGALKGFFIHYKSKSEINSLDASTSTVYTHTVLSQWRGLPMAALTSHIMFNH